MSFPFSRVNSQVLVCFVLCPESHSTNTFKTIEMLQCARIFKANFCLKVHRQFHDKYTIYTSLPKVEYFRGNFLEPYAY